MDARREADDQDAVAVPSPRGSTVGTARTGRDDAKEEGDGEAAAQPLVTSERLRKQRRNERDRQRSFAKRESMKQMRRLVQELEAQKQQLVARSAAADDAHTTRTLAAATVAPSLLLRPSAETPVRRENYVQLAGEIERFRRQNARMTQQLRERDLFNSCMQNLLLDFQHADDSDSDGAQQQQMPPQSQPQSQSQPLNGSSGVGFTPLTLEEGRACVRQTLQHIARARLLYASDESFRARAPFLGWRQFAQRRGAAITFATKKTLPNAAPAQLAQSAWDLLADSESIRRLAPEQLRTLLRPLQRLSEHLLVVDRRTEDRSRLGVGSQPLALRTIYVLFREAQTDGSHVIGMQTVDLPLVKRLLRHDECWCEILYWVRFSPERPGGGTTVEFGGCNTYTREEIASSWLTELMFLASRWEALAVAPGLLQQ